MPTETLYALLVDLELEAVSKSKRILETYAEVKFEEDEYLIVKLNSICEVL